MYPPTSFFSGTFLTHPIVKRTSQPIRSFYLSLLRMQAVNNIPATASPTLPLKHRLRLQPLDGNIPSKTTGVISCVLDAGGDNKHGSEDKRASISTLPVSNSHKEAEKESVVSANFVKGMVPFYAQCLIEVGVHFCFYFG